MRRKSLRPVKQKQDEIKRQKEKNRNKVKHPVRKIKLTKRRKKAAIKDEGIQIYQYRFSKDNVPDIAKLAEMLAERVAEMDVEIDVVIEPVEGDDSSALDIYTDEVPENPVELVKKISSALNSLEWGD